MEAGNKEKKLLALIEHLKKENEQLKENNKSLSEVIAQYKNISEEKLKAMDFIQNIEELKKLQNDYRKTTKELAELKISYEAKLKELVKQYTK